MTERNWTTDDVYGLTTLELPSGYRPLEAVCSVKCLDEDGNVVILHRYSKTITLWESLGMVECMSELLRRDLKEGFEPASGPEDNPDGD